MSCGVPLLMKSKVGEGEYRSLARMETQLMEDLMKKGKEDAPNNFGGVKENYGATARDIGRGFTDGAVPEEEDILTSREFLYEELQGGFCGRAGGWER